MKVRLSGQARTYIREEAAYLRRHSAHAARNFRNRIAEACENLASFPDIGRDIQYLPVEAARRFVSGNYVLDYEVRNDETVILSIRHGQQIEMDPDMDPDIDYEEPPDDGRS